LFRDIYNTRPIYGELGIPTASHLARRQLSSLDALGLALFFLSSRAEQREIAIIFGLTYPTFSRYIWFTIKCLIDTLELVPEAQILFPTLDRITGYAAAIEEHYPHLQGIYGFLDGNMN
jgi:hypothetical protein